MTKPYEIEQKYRVASPSAFRRLLKKIKARKFHDAREHNDLYDRKGRLRSKGCLLRLRHHGGKTGKLTFKGRVVKSAHKKREEIELDVRVQPMRRILEALGYKKTAEYWKFRAEYHFGSAKITLDHVPTKGWFCEIEGSHAQIHKIEKLLGFSAKDREERSYLQIYLSKSKR